MSGKEVGRETDFGIIGDALDFPSGCTVRYMVGGQVYVMGVDKKVYKKVERAEGEEPYLPEKWSGKQIKQVFG